MASVNTDRGVVFAFGRFQPCHRGHVVLAHFVEQTAKRLHADGVIFGSPSQDPKKNPLPWALKMRLFKQLVGPSTLQFDTTPGIVNPWAAVVHLIGLGYTRIYLVAAGDDRVPGFQSMLRSLQKTPEAAHVQALEVISSDVPGAARIKGVSGTAARAAAAAGDLEAFVDVVGPQNPRAAEQIYRALRQYMGIKESTVEWIARRWKQGRSLCEVSSPVMTIVPVFGGYGVSIDGWTESGPWANERQAQLRIDMLQTTPTALAGVLRRKDQWQRGRFGAGKGHTDRFGKMKVNEAGNMFPNAVKIPHPRFNTLEDAYAFAAKESAKRPKGYVMMWVLFGEVDILYKEKLPTSVYASDDWEHGYWKAGVHYEWSAARKRRAQQATDRLSGVQ